MTSKINEAVQLYKTLSDEYTFDADVLTADGDRERLSKWILDNRLTSADRIIIQLFAELGSLRKLGAQLGVSKSTAEKEVNRIRKIIFDEYNNIQYERIHQHSNRSSNDNVAH